jgi:hypothetical protein
MGVYSTACSWLTHPLVAGPVGGAIIVAFAKLDAKLRNVKREKETYWKLFIVTSLVFATVVYLVSAEFTKTDEFLTQQYDQNPPSLYPRSKGGYGESAQPAMAGPSETVAQMMENLPKVEMKSSRLPGYRSSRHGGRRHSSHRSSHRSSRHGRSKH